MIMEEVLEWKIFSTNDLLIKKIKKSLAHKDILYLGNRLKVIKQIIERYQNLYFT